MTTLNSDSKENSFGADPLVLLGGFAQGAELIDRRELADEVDESLKQSLSQGDLETAIKRRMEVEALRSRDPRARYQDLLEQLALCEEEGDEDAAMSTQDQIRMVKTFLPENNLEGLWVGRSGSLKKQVIRITYQNDTLVGTKAYNENIVPVDEVIFKVDLRGGGKQPEPIKVEDVSDRSLRQLERFKAQGRVVDTSSASSGLGSSEEQRRYWVPGQLIIVGDHFAFAWLPLGVQIFFMRVPENISEQLESLEKDRNMLTRAMSNSAEETELRARDEMEKIIEPDSKKRMDEDEDEDSSKIINI